MSAPEITNPRGAREWTWIVAQVGEARALDACAQLGGRRPFPLNVARALGLQLPASLAEEPAADREAARARLAKLRADLTGRRVR